MVPIISACHLIGRNDQDHSTNRNVIITCAVTGAGDTCSKHPDLPVTPQQVADAAISAAQAGAAIVHIQVRDPETGKGSRDIELFTEAVDRVRASDVDVVINLTAGIGGAWFPSEEDPALPGPGGKIDLFHPVQKAIIEQRCIQHLPIIDTNIGFSQYAAAREPYAGTHVNTRNLRPVSQTSFCLICVRFFTGVSHA